MTTQELADEIRRMLIDSEPGTITTATRRGNTVRASGFDNDDKKQSFTIIVTQRQP